MFPFDDVIMCDSNHNDGGQEVHYMGVLGLAQPMWLDTFIV